MQLALALRAPHGLWFSTSPHPHHLSHQEMKAIQSYLPHITFKNQHVWQNTKERFTAGLSEDVPPPTLCLLLKPPHHSPSLQGHLLVLLRGKAQQVCSQMHLLQSSPGTSPAAVHCTGYPALHANREMESAPAKLASCRKPETTSPLLEKGAGKSFPKGHNIQVSQYQYWVSPSPC